VAFFTGSFALHPITQVKIPIWVADYVLIGYGTGAIMAVPSHDQRDFSFAKTYRIPIHCILDPDIHESSLENLSFYTMTKEEALLHSKTATGIEFIRQAILNGEECWSGNGKMIKSCASDIDLNGLSKTNAINKITSFLEQNGIGCAKVNYKIRDWLFSRQRYWGEPFPIIHWEDGEISTLDTTELPLKLPELDDFKPSDTAESPLQKQVTGSILKMKMAVRDDAKQIPCHSGQVLVGIIFVISILKTIRIHLNPT
jgi:leucyl-tRNA synthetase